MSTQLEQAAKKLSKISADMKKAEEAQNAAVDAVVEAQTVAREASDQLENLRQQYISAKETINTILSLRDVE